MFGLPALTTRSYNRLMAASGSATRIPIVDSHHHVWNLSVRAQPFLESDEALAPLRRNFSVDDLLPQATAAGVTATVVVQTVTEPGETPELLALALAEPLVAAVVGWTDLTMPTVADAIAELRAMPGGQHLAGIRHPLLTEPELDWISRPEVRRGLAAVAASGLTFDLVLRPSQLPAAISAAADMTGLTFVLDHLGNVEVGPIIDKPWAAAFTAFARLPNTVCKLSGILSAAEPADSSGLPGGEGPSVDCLRPYFDLALDSFGPDRLMFGSDWPFCASYRGVVAAAVALTSPLSEPEQEAILVGTARSVYQIGAG
jgi:L-fuconolactonase